MTCQKCWRDDAHSIEITKGDEVKATAALCCACLANAATELAALRVEFEALLATGMSREQANAIMIAKIDGQGVLS